MRRTPLSFLFDKNNNYLLINDEMFSDTNGIKTDGWIITEPRDFKLYYKANKNKQFNIIKSFKTASENFAPYTRTSVLLFVQGIMNIKKDFKDIAETDSMGNKWLNTKIVGREFNQILLNIKNSLINSSLRTKNRIKTYLDKERIRIKDDIIDRAVSDPEFFKKFILDSDSKSFLDSIPDEKVKELLKRFKEKQNRLLDRKYYFGLLTGNVSDKKCIVNNLIVKKVYIPRKTEEEFIEYNPAIKYTKIEKRDLMNLEKMYE